MKTVLEDDLTFKQAGDTNLLKNKNILMATGLQCKDSKSQGIPADVFGIYFIAILLKQSLNFNQIIHLIADEHA